MITFFGASLTQQKNGYAIQLKKKLKDPVKIFGNGGMHLSNAGICYIDEILKCAPEYCFIDWFSTDYIETNEDTENYLDTIIYKFSRANCRLVFLFFPRLDDASRQRFYDFVKSFLVNREVYFLDINAHHQYSPDLVKDSVHTTDLGSQQYADTIYNQFIQVKDKILIPSNIRCTDLVDIKYIVIDGEFHKNLTLFGSCKIITFEMQIGRYSGIVKINNLEHNVWDVWCHYDRPSCKLDNILVEGNLRIDILQDLFDASKCRRDGIRFENISKKLIIKKVFYIGEYLFFKEGV